MTGWLVPPADASTLAEALRDALGLDAGERAALGARARRHVHGAFSLTSLQNQTLAVYDGLIGSKLAERFEAERRKRLA